MGFGFIEILLHTGFGNGTVPLQVLLQNQACQLLTPSSHTSAENDVSIRFINQLTVLMPCFPSVFAQPGLFGLSTIPSPQRAI
jgi:hypothetical protein